MSEIEISIKHLSSKTYKLKVKDDICVKELKALLEKETGFKAAELKLIFKGKILTKEDDKLSELNV